MKPVKHPNIWNFKDISGNKFNRLKVLWYVGKAGKNDRQSYWWCICDCGVLNKYTSYSITSGGTKSCGCYSTSKLKKRNTTHGMGNTIEYNSYIGAKGRCNNNKNNRYKYYGGRGIKFLFNSFEEFYKELGKRPTTKHSIDRIDVNGHYEKGNVRWATIIEQANNKRSNIYYTYNGQTKTLASWCRLYKVKYHNTWERINRDGWTFDKAITNKSV